MSTVWLLIRKEFLIDFRQKYPIAGIILYIFATIYISYLSFQGIISPITWNALLWIVILFASVTGLSKSFIGEEKRSLYYYLTVPSHSQLIGKLTYYSLYGWVLVALVRLFFGVFLPFPVQEARMDLFTLVLATGSLGLSAGFTMVSSLASKTSNASTLMAVLGFPVIIPVLLLSVVISRKIISGAAWSGIQGSFTYLVSVIVIIIAVSFILFPYSSRD